MSRQYSNITSYLNKGGFKLLTSQEDYILSKENDNFSAIFTYMCNNNHIKSITIASFINKKSKIKDNFNELCADCIKSEINQRKLIELQNEVKVNGHKIITYENNKNIIYECGNCSMIKYKNILMWFILQHKF